MSVRAEPIQPVPPAGAWQPWRPAGAVFLLVSLCGLAAGMFVQLVLPRQLTVNRATLPALAALSAAQSGFLILFGPMIAGGRLRGVRRPGAAGPSWANQLRLIAEYVLWLVAGVPLYIVAAWVSDATAVDVARAVLYLSAVAVGAWGLGLWCADGKPPAMTAAVLLAVLTGVGLPGACYLLAEFTDSWAWVDRLWYAAPATCAYALGETRSARWVPGPLWAWLFWPGAGAVLALARLACRAKGEPPPADVPAASRAASAASPPSQQQR